MGFLLKPRLSEEEAAGIFLGSLMRSVRNSWARILEIVRPTFPGRTALIDNEQLAQGEFFLTVVAGHVEDLGRVFDAERAERLRGHILGALGLPPFCRAGDERGLAQQQETLAAYRRCWTEAKARGEAPMSAAAGLLRERLSETFSGRVAHPAAGRKEEDDLASILANFDVGWWRYFNHKYRIERPKRAGAR